MKVLPEIVPLVTTGNINADTGAPVIAAPPTLAIGMVHGVLVVFGQATTASQVFTPAGMSTSKPATDAAQRQMAFFWRPIKTAADLAAAQSTQLRAAAAATRVVALSFAVAASDGTMPNLDAPVAGVGDWRVTSTGALVNNYVGPVNPPASALVLYGTYSNNSASTTHPVHTSPWGVMLKQAMALSGVTATESDTILSLAAGGTNTTFSIATANSGSYGVAFASVPVPDTRPRAYVMDGGVRRAVRVAYAEKDGVLRKIARVLGDASDPEPGTVTPTDGMAFDASAIQTAMDSEYLLVSHDFPPYPIAGINDFNTPDYYDRNYLQPTGESSAYLAEGGLLRDRPIYTTVTGATDAEKRKNLHIIDLQRMTERGVDVSLTDLLGDTGRNSDYVNDRIAARAGMPAGTTLIGPMLDATGTTATAGVARSATFIGRFVGKTGTWYLPDGRMVVAAFKVEDADTPPAFWVDLANTLKTTYGVDVAYLFSFNSYTSTNINNIKNALVAAGLPSALYGTGPWGMSSDPALVASASNFVATAEAAGHLSFSPLQGWNDRPGDGVNATDSKVPAGESASAPHGLYDEAANTSAFRAQWEKHISQGSQIVMEVTSNDYSEGGQFSPSLTFGYAKSDLSLWYAYRHKKGVYPQILRDNVMLSHRSHFSTVDSTADITGSQTAFQRQWERGGTETPPQDMVEAIVFATAACTLEITVGSTVTTHAIAGAGLTSVKVPLGLGRVSARILRSNVEVIKLVSPVKVVAKPVIQNMMYFLFSALRGTALQGDPTVNKTLTMAADTVEPAPSPITKTVAQVLNIGSTAGMNHYEVQTSYPGATAFTHTMTELINGYQRTPELLPTSNTRVGIRTRVDAEIMANSSWPRNEFRGVNKDGSKQAYNAKVGEHWQHQRGKLLHIPPNKSEIVLAQLHNGASDRIALRIQKTGTPNNRPRLIWRVNGAEVYVFKDPILAADDPAYDGYEWRAAWRVGGAGVADGVVRLYDGDMTTPVYTSTASKLVATAGVTTWYDKAGNYLQTTDGHDPDNTTFYDVSTEYGYVELFDLRHGHSYWNETNALGYPF